jgi:predicted NBD/HSP70 family sugar kinase
MATISGRRDDPGRSRNLRRILRRIHESPSTRSDLTRLTGLNRSTVAGLVGDLVERGLAEEHETSSEGQVGRPSPLVAPSDRPLAIAVNPEIDAITIGAVLLGGRVMARKRIALGHSPSVAETVDVVVEQVGDWRREWRDRHDLVGVGVAVPGLVRREDASVRFAPHLGWRDAPLGALLADAVGLPVEAANDAALGARAEWTFGAGRGVNDLVYVNGGASGIGGGIISGGTPLQGRHGNAGELGHLPVRTGGGADSAGLDGTLESEVRRIDLLRALGLDSADPDELELALLESTSPLVEKEIHRQIDVLVLALAGAVTLLDTDRIVLGGFLGSLAAVDIERIRAGVERHSLVTSAEIDIVRSLLGSDLLMIGAGELPFTTLLESL